MEEGCAVTVRSGGQSGGDQAGIIAARALHLPTGGWAPKGWRTDEGPAPWLADYGLVEHPSPEYPPRTGCNVRDNDATLILGDASSHGCALTLRYCAYYKKPFLVIPRPFENIEAAAAWIRANAITSLNVAGNRERSSPGIFHEGAGFLYQVLAKVKQPAA